MNIHNILLSFINSCIEIVFFSMIIFSLLQKNFKIKFYHIILCIAFIMTNIVLNIFIKNQLIYTLISMFIILMITIIISDENIIHSFYLFVISYCISLIIQLLLAIPFNFLLSDSFNPLNMTLGNLLTLVISYLVCRFLPIHYIYDFALTKDLYCKLILSNILISAILIICLYRIKISNTIIIFPIIAVYLILVVIFNIIFINSKVQIKNQQNVIDSYNEYLPVVEELIKQVQVRQHQYKNDLASLKSLTLTCKNYDLLCSELTKNIELLSIDSTPSFLLSFNLKLMSGFLYSEYIKANNSGINMSFHIQNYNIQTIFPEYRLTQAIGILIDNAIEASIEDDTIFIKIDCINNKFIFSISNPGPTITSDLLNSMFAGGYSTKNDYNRGTGLYTLKKMLDKSNGTICVSNENIYGKTYIKFTIQI